MDQNTGRLKIYNKDNNRFSRMQNLEEQTDCTVTTNGSVTHESCDVEILDHGRSISDFIDEKIKVLESEGSEDSFCVASLDSLYMRHLRWTTNLPRVQPFYAVKCNSIPTVLKTLSALGTGFDCASKGEIKLALSLGVTPDKIIYAHTTKPLSHIRYACSHGVNMMTFDNEEELMKISLVHPKARLVLRITVDDSKSMIRLNSKFGARLESVPELLRRAKELDLEVIGVSFHVGSGCTDSLSFRQAIEDARHAFDVANLLGFQMSLLDIGGGLSGRDVTKVTFEECAEVINAALREFFPPEGGVKVIAEPGRYYVESAFTLVTNVIAKNVLTEDMDEDGEENSPNRTMMYYLSDGLHGSMGFFFVDFAHGEVEPYPCRAVKSNEQRYRSIFWGPTCNSGDKIAEGFRSPELYIGDWLLVDDVGAYSASLSTDFNGFERAQIYTVMEAETWNRLNLKF